jgi:hypothetical protein
MHLAINGSQFKIGQIGPGFIMLKEATAHAPCDGEVFVSIDGKQIRERVHLPDGICPDRTRTTIADPVQD